MKLRGYQSNGIEEVRRRLRMGKHRILFVLATGGGKTVVAAHVVISAIARGSRVLFAAHRRELIKQCFCKLVRAGVPPEQIGIIMAGVPLESGRLFASDARNDEELWRDHARRRPNAPVQIASIDTLRNKQPPPADLVFIDEAHRALSPSYRALFELYPNAVHLGLTATPWRADNKGLGEVYEDLVVIASPRALMAEGHLEEPRIFTVPAADLPDLARIKIKGGDYDEIKLAAAVDQVGLVGNIVEHWGKHGRELRTVVFATSVAHSQHIRDRFRAAGVAAEHLDGETPTNDRDMILLRLERGETRVVVNCGVLCEGWDQPAVKCGVLARPTKSLTLYLQQIGRFLRPWEGVRPIILDHAGCAIEHGLPQDEREYSLEVPRRRAKSESTTSITTCEQCYAVLPSQTKVCPECGNVLHEDSPERVPTEAEGELVEVVSAKAEEQRRLQLRAELNELVRKCDRAGGELPGSTNRWLIQVTKKRVELRSDEELRRCITLVKERLEKRRRGPDEEAVAWDI